MAFCLIVTFQNSCLIVIFQNSNFSTLQRVLDFHGFLSDNHILKLKTSVHYRQCHIFMASCQIVTFRNWKLLFIMRSIILLWLLVLIVIFRNYKTFSSLQGVSYFHGFLYDSHIPKLKTSLHYRDYNIFNFSCVIITFRKFRNFSSLQRVLHFHGFLSDSHILKL